jgi:membrane protein
MIVPVCLFFALLMMRGAAKSGAGFSLQRIFPMFVLYFVLACIVNTTGIIPAEISHGLGTLGKFSIVLAMSAIGLNTDLPSLIKNGTRPLILGMVCWIAVAGTSLIVQHALGLL